MVLVVKKLPANAGDIRDMGSTLGLGRSPGGGHRNLLQYSCLENLMDRGAWQATVYRVEKSLLQLKRLTTHLEDTIKDTDEQPDEEIHRTRSGRVHSAETLSLWS